MKELKTLRGLAMLPLYDWPELHHLTDGVWACIREAARDQGLDLPADLDHRAQRGRAAQTPRALGEVQLEGFGHGKRVAD